MCLIAFSWQPDAPTPLVLAANRDEFFERPTEPMHWWPGEPLLAGRDLRDGGTWLGLTRDGRFAALTNYRDPTHQRPQAPSRGALPLKFLRGQARPQDFVDALQADA
ncbi:MAG: NRDE family protein, partial [Betaproteobacteria bacterium]|nr:NRDE family protein [Betaproteobacteria bacterium]